MTRPLLRFKTIRGRTTAILIAAVLLSLLAYTLGVLVSEWSIDRFYLSGAMQNKRNDALAQRLQEEVRQREIAGADSAALLKWIQDNEFVTLVVFVPGRPIEIDGLGAQELPNDADLPWQLSKQGYNFYTISFSDGDYSVAVVESSELHMYQIGRYVSLAAAFAVLFLIMLVHSRWITERIRVLSGEVNAVSHGEIEHEIVPRHRDEISSLAQDVEQMRSTIIQRTRSEQSALEANSELITALSHDIRNPLTALIGYLELLEMDLDALPESDRFYVRASLDKSYRIRDLTSEMFRYFLVYGKEAQSVELEEYDAQEVLWQMLGECSEDLLSRGFQVRNHPLERECTLRTDMNYLKRVVDNLESNIIKYADPAAPVQIGAHTADGLLTIRFRNRAIPGRRETVESNRVGLRTCYEIMKMLGGKLYANREGEDFVVEIILPIQEK
ncbi:MAG: HAMP domain-containing histidine kinase [Oscillospiraceae bacterium]|nr:HAMP domain-containing histidine kinase [Oscillospiraceae bacterium]